jgi:ADP-dependent NAD(P)H-hydrate dehydratase
VSEPLPPIPARDARGHKGTFGTVVVVGGSRGADQRMVGAPALAALGALRAGAGLARILAPAGVLEAALTICPSATGSVLPVDAQGEPVPGEAAAAFDACLAGADSLVIGPGLGQGKGRGDLVLRALQQEDVPIVADADALNAMASTPDLFRDFRARAVLTPHPGEFARLAAALRITHSPTDDRTRPAAAESLAQRLGCIVVLKGPGTIVSDGHSTWTCPHGHACLATAGTGDVLAGVIAGLIAQFAGHARAPMSLFDAARLGVHAHACAGEAWAASHGAQAGLLAQELAQAIPAQIEVLRAC